VPVVLASCEIRPFALFVMMRCALFDGRLSKGKKRPVMIPCVIGFSGPPLNHDPFSIARAASYLGIHIILPIAASR
jgi:hypothetical protein